MSLKTSLLKNDISKGPFIGIRTLLKIFILTNVKSCNSSWKNIKQQVYNSLCMIMSLFLITICRHTYFLLWIPSVCKFATESWIGCYTNINVCHRAFPYFNLLHETLKLICACDIYHTVVFPWHMTESAPPKQAAHAHCI